MPIQMKLTGQALTSDEANRSQLAVLTFGHGSWPSDVCMQHPLASSLTLHVVQIARSKTCETCQVEKPAAQFSLNGGSKDGLAPHCQECMTASGRPGGQPGGQPGQMPLKRPGRRPRVPAAHPVSEKVLRHLLNARLLDLKVHLKKAGASCCRQATPEWTYPTSAVAVPLWYEQRRIMPATGSWFCMSAGMPQVQRK